MRDDVEFGVDLLPDLVDVFVLENVHVFITMNKLMRFEQDF